MVLDHRQRAQVELTLLPPLRSLIPDDHILVRIDAVLDLSWVRGDVEGLYCLDNGRPGLDPEVVVRLMLAGLVEGIVHDRALLRRVQTDIALRWFIGYRLDEELPDHSTLTRVRERWGAEVFERVFERTVAQCMAAGLVEATAVHVDSTLIRADASPNSFVKEHVARVAATHGDLEAEGDAAGGVEQESSEEPVAVGPAESAAAEDGRDARGDVALGPGSSRKSKDSPEPVRRSQTDPDCRFGRSGRQRGYEPSYKVHAVVEDSHGVVVGCGLTAGNVHDGETLMGLLAATQARTKERVERVAADTAYGKASNLGALERAGIEAVIPPQAPSRHRGGFPAFRFSYDPQTDRVKCPRKRYLHRHRETETGVEYRSQSADCRSCRHAGCCLSKSSSTRTILIVHDHEALVRARRRQWRGEIRSNPLCRRRWSRVERTFGESKCRHGLRRAARRGLTKVWVQVQLAFSVQNLRRLARHLRESGAGSGLRRAAQRLTRALLGSLRPRPGRPGCDPAPAA